VETEGRRSGLLFPNLQVRLGNRRHQPGISIPACVECHDTIACDKVTWKKARVAQISPSWIVRGTALSLGTARAAHVAARISRIRFRVRLTVQTQGDSCLGGAIMPRGTPAVTPRRTARCTHRRGRWFARDRRWVKTGTAACRMRVIYRIAFDHRPAWRYDGSGRGFGRLTESGTAKAGTAENRRANNLVTAPGFAEPRGCK